MQGDSAGDLSLEEQVSTQVTVTRMVYTPDGTFGVLWVSNKYTCLTFEPPWLDNAVNVSCIPVGTYLLMPAIHHISTPDPTDDYRVYEIADVDGRSAIHIHVGNILRHTKGCPLLGVQYGITSGYHGVLHSQRAFDRFMKAMEDLRNPRITVQNFDEGESQGVL